MFHLSSKDHCNDTAPATLTKHVRVGAGRRNSRETFYKTLGTTKEQPDASQCMTIFCYQNQNAGFIRGNFQRAFPVPQLSRISLYPIHAAACRLLLLELSAICHGIVSAKKASRHRIIQKLQFALTDANSRTKDELGGHT